jgi:hypothetical protein
MSCTRLIGQLLSQLHNRAMLPRRISLSEPTRLREMLHEISSLPDAFAAHDSRAVWSISVHHISQAERAALKRMRQNELNPGSLRRKRISNGQSPDRIRFPAAGRTVEDAWSKPYYKPGGVACPT